MDPQNYDRFLKSVDSIFNSNPELKKQLDAFIEIVQNEVSEGRSEDIISEILYDSDIGLAHKTTHKEIAEAGPCYHRCF